MKTYQSKKIQTAIPTNCQREHRSAHLQIQYPIAYLEKYVTKFSFGKIYYSKKKLCLKNKFNYVQLQYTLCSHWL
jgi:hypothetical protein